jgi:RNA polymerase sigma-70 factor (ECF subfamily)
MGSERVARVLAAGVGRIAELGTMRPAEVNGFPALVFRVAGEIDTVLALHLEDGLITGIYAVRNPAKLSHMDRETTLSRLSRA